MLFVFSMCMVLHQHDHDHDHGGHGGHGGHGHSHKHDNGHTHGRKWWHKLLHRHHEEEEDDEGERDRQSVRRAKKAGHNINVRAAFIHVIGDLVQSIGVVIAGYVIKFFVRK